MVVQLATAYPWRSDRWDDSVENLENGLLAGDQISPNQPDVVATHPEPFQIRGNHPNDAIFDLQEVVHAANAETGYQQHQSCLTWRIWICEIAMLFQVGCRLGGSKTATSRGQSHGIGGMHGSWVE